MKVTTPPANEAAVTSPLPGAKELPLGAMFGRVLDDKGNYTMTAIAFQ